ncbi:MAG: DUF975 family protein [Oscillospiraceae bacterium]|nr:DUF975 family protein [Oscillospiraceae bacterium]
MRIPSNRVLKGDAARRVAASENAGKVVSVYIGIITLTAILVTVINFCLDLQIAKTGGLSSMGLRSVLSTIQSVLPMLQSMLSMCLQIGYIAAMMRVSRRQYTSPQTLKLGFDRFWLLLRTILLQSCIYLAICMACFWLSSQIFAFTPMAASVTELLMPVMEDGMLPMEALLDETLYNQLLQAMLPVFAIFGILYAAMMIPITYSFRLVNYIIVDKPGFSAGAILRESKKLMKGHRFRLFKLDLGLWWWYALAFLSSLVGYGDSLLPLLGISLPMSETVAYFLFYGLFLISQFAIFYFLRNRVEVAYIQVYDILRPKEQDNGVVLGNIFQM